MAKLCHYTVARQALMYGEQRASDYDFISAHWIYSYIFMSSSASHIWATYLRAELSLRLIYAAEV